MVGTARATQSSLRRLRKLVVRVRTRQHRQHAFAHPCISANHYDAFVPEGTVRPGWPPRPDRPIVGSLPTVAARADFRSKIAVGSSSGPVWLIELEVRIARKGREKMSKHSTVCAGIDTGKHKLDVALEGRSQELQVQNT